METLRNILSLLLVPAESWTFVSMQFFALFLFFYLIYLSLSRLHINFRYAYTFAFSLFFAYKGGGWWFVLPLLTVVSWLMTRLMNVSRRRKLLCAMTVVVELLPLLLFRTVPALHPIVPIGIAFYSLQAVSYTVDVYRRRFPANATLLAYAFYLSYFPLLLAGPITRASVLMGDDDKQDKGETPSPLYYIIIGIIKKAVIADTIAQYTAMTMTATATVSGVDSLLTILGYTFQIYFDFSGYSDIAIGLSLLMGFRLPANFMQPYQSLSVTSFWHRWHISLSSWLRDYVYIPLGGNRVSAIHRNLNLIITMTVAALWHGTTVMFMVWGAIHAAALVVQKTFSSHTAIMSHSKPMRFVSWLTTFIFINVTWLFFRCSTLADVRNILAGLFSNWSLSGIAETAVNRPQLIVVILIAALATMLRQRHAEWLAARFTQLPFMLKLILFAAAVQTVINVSTGTAVPFIYTRF